MLLRSFYWTGSIACLLGAQACGGTAPLVTSTGSTGGGSTVSAGGAPSSGSGGQVSGSGGSQVSSGGTGGDLIPVGEDPTALEAAQAMGRGVNLGQIFESTQHPRTLEAASAKIDAYYERGFRTLRIPITWTEAVDGNLLVTDATTGEVNREHPRLAVIESVVDYALSKPGLFVIINAHHEVALKTESRSAVLERLWQDVADIFKDRGHRLLFELLNEPHREDSSAMPAADLRQMIGLAYDQVRAVDAKRIVLFGGNQWFAAS